MKSAISKIALVLVAMAGVSWSAQQFSPQKRLGAMPGDQWEPAIAADGIGRIYVLYPQYGPVADCAECSAPAMLLTISTDNGRTWKSPRPILSSGSGQFDAQIVVDPSDRHTIYAAWLQSRKREIIVAKSTDAGATWTFSVPLRSEVELDKPVLTVRGQSVYVGFNHEEEIWSAASQDGGRTFALTRVNSISSPGWSLLGGATVDPAGNAFLAWASYSKIGAALGTVRLLVAKSEDLGKNWTTTVLDTSAAGPGCAELDCGEAYLGAQISLASDAGGTIYAVWSSGARTHAAQKIYFSSSTNNGQSWLSKVSVSRAAAGVEHAFPTIVAGRAGDVRIAWMDTRTTFWNTYYRSSNNGGATWSDETRMSGFVPGYKYIAKKGFRFPFGDYFGLAIDNHEDTQAVWGEGMNYQSPGSIWHSTGK